MEPSLQATRYAVSCHADRRASDANQIPRIALRPAARPAQTGPTKLSHPGAAGWTQPAQPGPPRNVSQWRLPPAGCWHAVRGLLTCAQVRTIADLPPSAAKACTSSVRTARRRAACRLPGVQRAGRCVPAPVCMPHVRHTPRRRGMHASAKRCTLTQCCAVGRAWRLQLTDVPTGRLVRSFGRPHAWCAARIVRCVHSTQSSVPADQHDFAGAE